MKKSLENRFSGKTYFYTIASEVIIDDAAAGIDHEARVRGEEEEEGGGAGGQGDEAEGETRQGESTVEKLAQIYRGLIQ